MRSVGMLMLAVLTLAVGSQALAQSGGKAAFYAHTYYSPEDVSKMNGAAAEIYVYTLGGDLVRSDMGNGAWAPGTVIEVDPGDYLIEVGTHRTRHNLRRYTAVKGKITEIPTGWVAITTWPRADQPDKGCQQWGAGLRAFVVDDEGKEHLVSENNANSEATSRLQLPEGRYRIYWHGLATDIDVQAHHLLHLGTGGLGPFAGTNPRLSAEKSDESGIPHIELCANGPTHVLAGQWWLSLTERIETHPYEKRVWQQIEVPALDESFAKKLKTDRVKGSFHRGAGAQGQALSMEARKALAGYKEGKLQNASKGGKFDIDTNPF